jgi:hypothetical protein
MDIDNPKSGNRFTIILFGVAIAVLIITAFIVQK